MNPEPNAGPFPLKRFPFIIITSFGFEIVLVICTTEFFIRLNISVRDNGREKDSVEFDMR